MTAERISEHGVFAALNPEVAGIDIALGLINPLSFRWELDFWGKNRAMMDLLMSRELAHHAEWAEVRLRLTTAIARSEHPGSHCASSLEVVEAMVELRLDPLNLVNSISVRPG